MAPDTCSCHHGWRGAACNEGIPAFLEDRSLISSSKLKCLVIHSHLQSASSCSLVWDPALGLGKHFR